MTIETLRPEANGVTNTFPTQYPNSTSHYDKVDEVISDGDATYVENNGDWRTELYALPVHVSSGVINSVTVKVVVRLTGTDDQLIYYTSLRTHSTNYGGGAEFVGSATYITKSYTWNTNPNTLAAWTWDEIDALEVGCNARYWGNSNIRVTQVYAEVDYTPPPIYPIRGFIIG